MSTSHDLFVPGQSVVHRLPAHCKLTALVGFVLVVVATPRTAYWAFGAYAALLLSVALIARIGPGLIARRMVVETPFAIFAVLLPFVASGPRIDVLGLAVSQPGLLGAWNILAKATLGVVASILLTATTDRRALLAGLDRLPLPRQLVQIAVFMIRYSDVIAEQLRRMRVARVSRGFVSRDLRGWPALARSAGALFIRTYERGERVHLAMLARGYTGTLPEWSDERPPGPAVWGRALVLPLFALAIAVTAGLTA